MKIAAKFRQVLYLKYALLFYLLLGGLDTLHHLHAASVLGHAYGMHSFLLGIILIPLAVTAVVYFLYSENMVSMWLFLSISTSAIALPGFYHGGWVHFVKLLAYLRVDRDSTNIRSLLPPDNIHLWLYEASGSLEFVLAIISSYFTYKLLVSVITKNYHFTSLQNRKT